MYCGISPSSFTPIFLFSMKVQLHKINFTLLHRRIIKSDKQLRGHMTQNQPVLPLVWMLHNRTLNNKINRIHERVLRVVYQNKTLTFDELLLKDNSVRVHHFLKLTLISIIYIIAIFNNIVVCKCCQLSKKKEKKSKLADRRL